jgi:hypothetical protein
MGWRGRRGVRCRFLMSFCIRPWVVLGYTVLMRGGNIQSQMYFCSFFLQPSILNCLEDLYSKQQLQLFTIRANMLPVVHGQNSRVVLQYSSLQTFPQECQHVMCQAGTHSFRRILYPKLGSITIATLINSSGLSLWVPSRRNPCAPQCANLGPLAQLNDTQSLRVRPLSSSGPQDTPYSIPSIFGPWCSLPVWIREQWPRMT